MALIAERGGKVYNTSHKTLKEWNPNAENVR